MYGMASVQNFTNNFTPIKEILFFLYKTQNKWNMFKDEISNNKLEIENLFHYKIVKTTNELQWEYIRENLLWEFRCSFCRQKYAALLYNDDIYLLE